MSRSWLRHHPITRLPLRLLHTYLLDTQWQSFLADQLSLPVPPQVRRCIRHFAFLVITRGNIGIGYYTADAFAKHGIERLAVTDFNAGALASSVKELQAKHPNVEFLPLELDVRDGKQVKAVLAQVVQKFGRLDIAVNNAGIRGPIANTDLVPEEEYENLIQTNMNGVWRCQKEVLSIFMKQEHKGLRYGRGVIINTASIFGLFGAPRGMPHTAYVTAKHGVVGMTKADAIQYGEHGIRINAICPGFVPSTSSSHRDMCDS